MADEIFVSRNMNYIYYKEYFRDFQDLASKEKTLMRNAEAITDFSFSGEMENIRMLKEMYQQQGSPLSRVELQTAYPGLLTGTGIPHDLKGQGGISGGFSFDHVTGFPYIPGSELKGVLRSYFPSVQSANKEEYEDFIRALLGVEELDVSLLEKILFEGHVAYIGGFLLAKQEEKVLKTEFFTPHKSKLRNPTPISILKVKPEVHFEFLFDLNGLDKELKVFGNLKLDILSLFKELLVLGGIGAKRNVGFSQFREV